MKNYQRPNKVYKLISSSKTHKIKDKSIDISNIHQNDRF